MTFGATLSLGALCLAVEVAVGVAPFDVLGLTDADAVTLRRLAAARLDDPRRHRRLVPSAAIDAALEARGLDEEARRACLRDGDCAAGVGRDAGADELLVGSAAGLGDTYVLRLMMIDARTGVVDQDLQQTVTGGVEALGAALEHQIDRLRPRDQPWYRRWWPWTILGAAVAAAVVVTAVVLARDDENPRDVYPLP